MKFPIFFFIFLIIITSCNNGNKIITPPSSKDNGGLIIPEGFGAMVVADSVGHARHIAVNSNGDIYIKLGLEKGDKGNVALRDTNNDGRADIIQRFGDYKNDGRFGTEMKIHDGYLFFSSEQVIYKQKLTANDLIPKSKIEVVLVDEHPVQWHNSKSLAFDEKGGMYVTFSAPTNVCENWNSVIGESSANMLGNEPCTEIEEHAGIWRFDIEKLNQIQSDGQKYAAGLRSIVAMTWNKSDKSLYAMQHGRDYLYGHAPQYYTPWENAKLPAEEFMKIKQGDNYGWPYAYYDHFKNKKMLAPEYGGDDIQDVKGFKNPLMGLPAHWAPNDILFYKGDMFPSRYKEGAFVAFHGSTNRNPYPQGGYIVAFIPFENGKPINKWEVFADGFAGVDTITNMAEAHYRPMGLAEGPDGSLYVCDSKHGKVWRIIFNGDAKNFGQNQLTKMEKLKSKSYLKEPDETADNLTLRKKLKGEDIYVSHCLTCHQKNGEGQVKRYPPLAGSEWVNGPKETLLNTIINGQRGEISVKGKLYDQTMPSFAWLSNEEIVAVSNYIKDSFGNKGTSLLTIEDVKKVRGK